MINNIITDEEIYEYCCYIWGNRTKRNDERVEMLRKKLYGTNCFTERIEKKNAIKNLILLDISKEEIMSMTTKEQMTYAHLFGR